MASEKPIVDRILKYLNDLPSCRAIKYHGSAYTRTGEPDIHGCYRGVALKLEVKQPGEEPTRIQVKTLEKWAAAGAITGVVRSVDDVESLLYEYDSPVHRTKQPGS